MSQDLSGESEDTSSPSISSHEILSSLETATWAIALPMGEFVYANAAIESLIGHTAHDLVNNQRTWDTLIHSEDVVPIRQQFSELRPGDRTAFECRISREDGRIQAVVGQAVLIGDAQSTPIRIQGFMSARELVAPLQDKDEPTPEILQHDHQFRSIFEQTSVGVVRLDAAGRYQEVNPCFCKMVGYSARELLQMTVSDLTHPDDLASSSLFQFKEQHTQEPYTPKSLAEGLTQEVRYVCKNEQVLWVKVVTSALQDTEHRRTLSPAVRCDAGYIALIWDIGDRKRAEQSLRQSQEMLRLVIDNIPQRIFWKDTNLVYLGCNQRQAEWAGLNSPKDIVGKTDYELSWPAKASKYYRDHDRRVIASREAEYYMSEIECHPNGQAFLLEVSKIPLHDSEGQIVGLLGTIDDITERKRAETDLIQKTAELQAVFAALPDIFFRIAADGTYLDCRAQNPNDLLFSPGQLLGKRVQDILPRPLGKGMWQGIQVTIRTQSLTVLEHAIEMPQGLEYFEARIVPYQDDEVLVLIRNETRRKQAEQALVLSERRFQRLAENLPGVIYQYLQPIDSEPGWFRYLSPSVRRLYGLPPQQMLAENRSMREMVHPEDWPHVHESLHQAAATLSPWRAEWRIETASHKEQKWIQSIARPERQPDGSVLWDGILLDITDRKRFETMLQTQAHREQALNQVIQAIRESLDLGTIFSTAASQTAELLDAWRVCIIRHAPERQTWQFVMDYSLHQQGTNLVGSDMRDSDRHLFSRLKQGNSLQISAQQLRRITNEDCRQIVEEAQGHWLIVPLMVAGKPTSEMPTRSQVVRFQEPPYVWGCLCLVSPQPHLRWQEADYNLAQVIANQLAIAIQQSELYHRIRLFTVELEHQVQQRTVDLEYALSVEALLKRIIDDVRDSLDEERILQTVASELATTLVLDCCNIALYDLDAGVAHIRQEHTTIDLPSLQGYAEPFDKRPEAYPQLLAGQMVYHSHIESDPLFLGYKPTLLCYPIVIEGEVLGDLWLYRPQYAAFSTIELRLVEKIVSQCAIAMRQARLYRAEQVQVQELERLGQLKDDFLCTISHELRTPIAGIHMATQMLELHLSQVQGREQALPEPIDQCLKMLRDGAEQEMALVNDLLDLQHLRAGTHPLEVSQIDVQTWLPHLIEAIDFQMQAHGQTLQLELSENLPLIYSDRAGLQRILLELLNNAGKYTPSGETISLRTAFTEHQIQFEIRNTGIEIPLKELPFVFDQFHRVPKADRWQHGGLGLGLALVQEWARHLQGKISVASDRNETRFTLTIPVEYCTADV